MTLACLEDHLVAASMHYGSLPVLLNLGAIMHARKHYAAALHYYLQVLAVDPSHSLALSNCHALWQALVNATTPITSRHAFLLAGPPTIYLSNGVVVSQPFVPDILTADAMEAIKADIAEAHSRGHRHIALAKLQVAVMHEPNNALLLNDLGAMQFQLGLVTDAIDSFRRALALQPTYVQALNNLATLAQDQGRDDDALELYHQAMAVDPFDAHVRYNVGNTLFHMQRYDRVVRTLVAAFGLDAFLEWTARDKNELGMSGMVSGTEVSDTLLRRLGALVAAMLVAYPSPTTTRFKCIQNVLTRQHGVPFVNQSAFEVLVRSTQKSFDRSWNVFGLALHAMDAMRNTDGVYRAIHETCHRKPSQPSTGDPSPDVVEAQDIADGKPLLFLVMQYYRPSDQARQDELDACLRSNLANDNIAEVHVLLEDPLDLTAVVGLGEQHKLHVAVVHHRLTMRAALEYANTKHPHSWWAIANADIYFDQSLRLFLDGRRLDKNRVVALTRWHFDQALGHATFQPRIDSQDAWIVYPSALPAAMLPHVDFYLGYLRTDSRFVAVLTSFNVSVENWGFHVKAIHVHAAPHRTYTSQHTAWGADQYLLLSLLNWET
ncbi:hypothetical protein H310_07585 [Aphanomyces invadans]|uniref:O-GlcNAc transferase C-terminal domain-containing protein n=1 Tax=Aphanomyces invadans TaxID=157072 RepID=A0A024U1T7_9STRA|nr:hypothetical protein H310_07585 [Aphanomyces invadans]ETW00185.1 hypothetical protein H310_07585 [Aphanomyces invadans]|eukprot:XP_008871210.1 hypothetical protein H310_07585 [Aphanomyces invadans]